MINNNLATLIEDEHQIASLLVRWGHARDSDDWETLAGCFHDDATIRISWISASAKDYIARSRAMAAARKTGEHAKHLISGPWIRVNRDRAFSRCHANLYVRTTIDGREFDLQSWIRFFDLLERRDGVWRIVKRTAVYEKDRVEPVDPRGIPNNFFDDMELSAFPASAKFLCYWQLRSGRSPSTDNIISVYSDKERELREEGERWLENG
jgi:SnoaL-like domain